MKYEFFADLIDLGIDEAEEVYTISLTETSPEGGPPLNYLLLQRSVAGIDDSDLIEPYIELNDSANGRFADSIVSAEFLPTYLHFLIKPTAGLVANLESPGEPIDDLVVRFTADAALIRKMKYALDLVISDGFAWRSVS